MFPAGRCFGRNLAPPGSFREFFGPSEALFALRNFLTFCTVKVLPPAVTIRNLLHFWGSSELREILWPPTKFDCMLHADPVNPVWGPMCPWGMRDGHFWGRAGCHFVSWGLIVSVRDPPGKKNADSEEMVNFFFPVAVPTGLLSSKTERFCPLVPPIGAMRTEKTWPFSGLRRGNTKSPLGLPLFLIRV